MRRRSTYVCCIKFTFHSSDNGLQETDKSLELPSFSCLSSDVGKMKFAKQTHMLVKKYNQSRRTNYSAEACTYDGKVLSNASSAAQERVGVLLLNLGGPETLNDVQPFLFNLFADPVSQFINYWKKKKRLYIYLMCAYLFCIWNFGSFCWLH